MRPSEPCDQQNGSPAKEHLLAQGKAIVSLLPKATGLEAGSSNGFFESSSCSFGSPTISTRCKSPHGAVAQLLTFRIGHNLVPPMLTAEMPGKTPCPSSLSDIARCSSSANTFCFITHCIGVGSRRQFCGSFVRGPSMVCCSMPPIPCAVAVAVVAAWRHTIMAGRC